MLAKIVINGHAMPIEGGKMAGGYFLGRLGFDWRNTALSRYDADSKRFVDIDTNEFFTVADGDRYVTRPE